MSDYKIPQATVEVASLLWALPLVPLVGGLIGARLALLSREQPEPERGAAWVPPAATWLALLAAALLSYRLVKLDGPGATLVAGGPAVTHLGGVAIDLSLSLDATSALLSLLLLLVASVAQLGWLISPVSYARGLLFSSAAAGATAAALLSLLSSGWAGAAAGAGLFGVAGALALGCLHPASTGPFRLGSWWVSQGAFALSGALLCAGLSGVWGDDLAPQVERPRVVAVAREGREAPRGPAGPRGAVTMTALPGAQVFVGGAALLATSPFVRAPLAVGVHDLRVVPLPGGDEIEIKTVRVQENTEVELVALTPGPSFRHLGGVLRAREGGLPLVQGQRLLRLRWAGLPVAAWIGGLMMLALIAGLLPPSLEATGASTGLRPLGLLVPQVGALLVAGHSAARGLPLLGAALDYPGWLSALPLAAALGFAVASWGQRQPGRALGLAAGAQVCLAAGALAAGAVEAGVLHLAVTAAALGLGLWALALVERHNRAASYELGALQGLAPRAVGTVRWLKVTHASLVGLVPLGGAFSTLELLRALPAAHGALVVVAAALGSFGLGRLVYTISEGDCAAPELPRNIRKNRQDDGDERQVDGAEVEALPEQIAPVLAAIAVLLGPLGAVTLYNAPLGAWLATTPLPRAGAPAASVGPFLALVVVSVAALAGARWSRGKYGEQRPSGWQEEERSRGPTRLNALLDAASDAAGERISAAARALRALQTKLDKLTGGT